MIWSADQQRMLAAMGYGLLRLNTAVQATPPAATSATTVEPPATLVSTVTGPFERLQRALQRSAGGSIEGLELPALDRLRADPAAKRALWPRLRALRRSNTTRL